MCYLLLHIQTQKTKTNTNLYFFDLKDIKIMGRVFIMAGVLSVRKKYIYMSYSLLAGLFFE